jgi:hypothetical protein
MKEIMKRTISLIIVCAIATGLTVSAFAETVNFHDSSAMAVEVEGIVEPETIADSNHAVVKGMADKTVSDVDVVVPTEFSMSINPETGNDIYTTGKIINYSNVPVKVQIYKIAAAGNNSCKVVSPDTVQDWSKLGTKDTANKIALGIEINKNSENIAWAPNENVNVEPFKTIKLSSGKCSGSTASIGLVAKHGNAFKGKYILNYKISYTIETDSQTAE